LTQAQLQMECKQCGCPADINNDSTKDEFDINCGRCGSHHSQKYEHTLVSIGPMKVEKELDGYGVSRVTMLDGISQNTHYTDPLTEDQINIYQSMFNSPHILNDQSYVVIYTPDGHKTLFGNPPKDFFLSYQEYIKKYHSEVIDS